MNILSLLKSICNYQLNFWCLCCVCVLNTILKGFIDVRDNAIHHNYALSTPIKCLFYDVVLEAAIYVVLLWFIYVRLRAFRISFYFSAVVFHLLHNSNCTKTAMVAHHIWLHIMFIGQNTNEQTLQQNY